MYVNVKLHTSQIAKYWRHISKHTITIGQSERSYQKVRLINKLFGLWSLLSLVEGRGIALSVSGHRHLARPSVRPSVHLSDSVKSNALSL